MAQAHSQLPSRREARKAATVPDPGSGRRRRLGGLLRALSLIVLPSPPDQAYSRPLKTTILLVHPQLKRRGVTVQGR